MLSREEGVIGEVEVGPGPGNESDLSPRGLHRPVQAHPRLPGCLVNQQSYQPVHPVSTATPNSCSSSFHCTALAHPPAPPPPLDLEWSRPSRTGHLPSQPSTTRADHSDSTRTNLQLPVHSTRHLAPRGCQPCASSRVQLRLLRRPRTWLVKMELQLRQTNSLLAWMTSRSTRMITRVSEVER